MHVLIHVKIPHEPFNTLVRNGTAGDKIKQILEDLRPEAVYFTEYNGQRGAESSPFLVEIFHGSRFV